MKNTNVIELMKKNGFSDKQISRIEEASLKDHLSLEITIIQLSKRFVTLSVMFILLIILSIVAPILNGDENYLQMTCIMVIPLLFLMKLLALDLCFKARRVARNLER